MVDIEHAVFCDYHQYFIVMIFVLQFLYTIRLLADLEFSILLHSLSPLFEIFTIKINFVFETDGPGQLLITEEKMNRGDA